VLATRNITTAGAASPGLRRFLRRAEVERVTGLPQSSLYDLIAKGKFPKPFPLSENRVAWLEDDVAA